MLWEWLVVWGPVLLEVGKDVVPLLWHIYRLYKFFSGR
jgi:hypothetical protein